MNKPKSTRRLVMESILGICLGIAAFIPINYLTNKERGDYVRVGQVWHMDNHNPYAHEQWDVRVAAISNGFALIVDEKRSWTNNLSLKQLVSLYTEVK